VGCRNDKQHQCHTISPIKRAATCLFQLTPPSIPPPEFHSSRIEEEKQIEKEKEKVCEIVRYLRN
jgi:hypothetical protein